MFIYIHGIVFILICKDLFTTYFKTSFPHCTHSSINPSGNLEADIFFSIFFTYVLITLVSVMPKPLLECSSSLSCMSQLYNPKNISGPVNFKLHYRKNRLLGNVYVDYRIIII